MRIYERTHTKPTRVELDTDTNPLQDKLNSRRTQDDLRPGAHSRRIRDYHKSVPNTCQEGAAPTPTRCPRVFFGANCPGLRGGEPASPAKQPKLSPNGSVLCAELPDERATGVDPENTACASGVVPDAPSELRTAPRSPQSCREEDALLRVQRRGLGRDELQRAVLVHGAELSCASRACDKRGCEHPPKN